MTQVALRPFRPWMIHEAYLSWLRDPEVLRYSELRHSPPNREACEKYLSSFDFITSYIWAIHAPTHVGNISANIVDGTASLGILIGDKTVWGKGIGTEAWRHAIGFLLTSQRASRIEAGTSSNHMAMLRIFARTNMELYDRIPSYFDPYIDLLKARYNPLGA